MYAMVRKIVREAMMNCHVQEDAPVKLNRLASNFALRLLMAKMNVVVMQATNWDQMDTGK